MSRDDKSAPAATSPISIERIAASEAPEAAPRLTEIALLAKNHWGYPQAWIREWTPLLTFNAVSIVDHPTWIARVGGKIVGFTVLHGVDPRSGQAHEDVVSLEHMWLHPDHHGLGLGRRLFDVLYSFALSSRASLLEVASDPYAEGFYRHMGFKPHAMLSAPVAGQDRELPVLRLSLK